MASALHCRFSSCCGERCGYFGVVKRRLARGIRRVIEHELASIRACVAIPETIVRQPVSPHVVENEWRRVVAHEFFGALIIGRGENLLRANGNGSSGNGNSGQQNKLEQKMFTHLHADSHSVPR